MPGTESIFTVGDREMNHRGSWSTRSTERGGGGGVGMVGYVMFQAKHCGRVE